jgi:hypothetical protein
VEEETGAPLQVSGTEKGTVPFSEKKLIARDDKNVPLVSTLDYAADAAARLLRVPAGFMRNKTQERIEALAADRKLVEIDLSLVEEGIEIGKRLMEEAIAAQEAAQAKGGLNDVGTFSALISKREVH